MNVAYRKHFTAHTLKVKKSEIVSIYQSLSERKHGLAISTQKGTELVKFDDILYGKSSSNYCTLYFKDGSQVMASKTLKSIVLALPTNLFFRIHQSYVVRLDSIQLVSSHHVRLKHGMEVPLSKSKKKQLLKKLEELYVNP